MTVYLQYKGGANWRVKKQSHISISKAPGALFRKNTVLKMTQNDLKWRKTTEKSRALPIDGQSGLKSRVHATNKILNESVGFW